MLILFSGLLVNCKWGGKVITFEQSGLFYLLIKYQLGSKMGKKINNKKSGSCEGRWCQKHHFQMRPLLISICNPKEDSLRLCPKFNRDQKTFQKVLPMLNLDHKYYTPLFILEQDQRLYIDHDKSSLRNFQNSKLSEQYEISQIVTIFHHNSPELSFMLPKVNTSNPYCRVCRQDYVDYLQHTDSARHRQIVGRHPYTAFIVELGENFKANRCQQKQNDNENREVENTKTGEPFPDYQIESQLLDKETGCRLKQSVIEKPSYEVNL